MTNVISLLFTPGRWRVQGAVFDDKGAANPADGGLVIAMSDDQVRLALELTLGDAPAPQFCAEWRLTATAPVTIGAAWTGWRDGAGPLAGWFVVAGDTILSTYRSLDGGREGVESYAPTGPDRWRCSGFLRGGARVVSRWSLDFSPGDTP